MRARVSLLDRALNELWLRECDRVGASPRIEGRPRVINGGTLTIGDHFELRSRPTQSHLIVSRGASLQIGHHVRISSGAAIACHGRVELGDDVSLGAFCMLMDTDFHVAGDKTQTAKIRPIVIEPGARIGHRVVVLPGARVGAGAIVRPGSVVAGDIPAGAVVQGNPARPESAESDGMASDRETLVPRIVQHALAMSRIPALDEARETISEWDSLGALRLILELEDRFQVTLTEDEINSARTIRDLLERVSRAQARTEQLSASAVV